LLKEDQQTEEKIKQEKTVRGFHYLIEEEYLLQHLQPLHQPLNKGLHQPPQQGTHQPLYQPTHAELKAKDETITILKKQLEQKDEQIRQLIERGREANILLKGYQDKYLLNASNEHEVTDRKAAKPADKPAHKSKSKKADQPKKRRFFSFLRGK
jgi:hypothetical protein